MKVLPLEGTGEANSSSPRAPVVQSNSTPHCSLVRAHERHWRGVSLLSRVHDMLQCLANKGNGLSTLRCGLAAQSLCTVVNLLSF